MPELLTLDRRDDGVAVITLRHGKVNALSGALVGEIGDAAGELTERPPGAVVVTGGERIFAAGADITEFSDAAAAERITAHIHGALDALAAVPRFVIAAVSGYALGGGCELALACHLRIASENAQFGLPEVKLGIIPGYGGTLRLPRIVGKGRALEGERQWVLRLEMGTVRMPGLEPGKVSGGERTQCSQSRMESASPEIRHSWTGRRLEQATVESWRVPS